MKIKRIVRILFIIVVLVSNIGCDQISKNIVRQRIQSWERISLLNNHLTVMKVENTGAFLSAGSTLPQPVKILFLIIFPLLVLLGSMIYLFTNRDLPVLMLIGICFIVSGGIGNIYDRILYGSVTDFLHIDFVLFETGIFNMGDVSIMTGLFILLCCFYFKRTELDLKA